MRILEDVGLLLMPNIRGLMYLERFIKNGVMPGTVIVQGQDLLENDLGRYPRDFFIEYSSYFCHDKDLSFYQNNYNLNIIRLSSNDINSPELKQAVGSAEEKYFVYSGGGIIKDALFKTGKYFIHAHSGKLPDYKGCTCIYYSMLKERACFATSFFMEMKIDAGDIILSKSFDVPYTSKQYPFFFDVIYDSWIRAEVIDLTIQQYIKSGDFNRSPQIEEGGDFYYVIHPFLKNAALSLYLTDFDQTNDKKVVVG